MSKNETTSPETVTLSAGEVQSLADRLFSRGVSTLSTASDQERRDLQLASRALRKLLHEIDRVAAQCDDTPRLLRNLQIDVGGC
jgi:hypothetical protein